MEDVLQAAEGTADGQVDDVDSMQTDIAQTEVAGNEVDGESHGAKGKQRADEPEVCYDNLFIVVFRSVDWGFRLHPRRQSHLWRLRILVVPQGQCLGERRVCLTRYLGKVRLLRHPIRPQQKHNSK